MPPTVLPRVSLPAVPFALSWDVEPVRSYLEAGSGALRVVAGAATDLFVDPLDNNATLNAPRLLGEPTGDFLLSAAVEVAFAADCVDQPLCRCFVSRALHRAGQHGEAIANRRGVRSRLRAQPRTKAMPSAAHSVRGVCGCG